jgi:arsenite methyltransferase
MDTREYVKEVYGNIARGQGGCGCDCGPGAGEVANNIGYSAEELGSIPNGSNLGLGSGNPTASAGLKEGETVLDLGSGAGFDCFVSANKVGGNGRVIGVDMTPEMVEKARGNAEKGGFGNVEFRLGEVENLPVEDSTVDVVISNCVINLSTDKPKAFQEVFRVLKPGGRIAISDVALTQELPEEVLTNREAYAGCVAGAILVDEYKRLVIEAGFRDVSVKVKESEASCTSGQSEGVQTTSPIVSVSVVAHK